MIERIVISLERETDRKMSEDMRRTGMAVTETPYAPKIPRDFS